LPAKPSMEKPGAQNAHQQHSGIVLLADLHHSLPQPHRLRDALQRTATEGYSGGTVTQMLRQAGLGAGQQTIHHLQANDTVQIPPHHSQPGIILLPPSSQQRSIQQPSRTQLRGIKNPARTAAEHASWPRRSAPLNIQQRQYRPCQGERAPQQHALLGLVALLPTRSRIPQHLDNAVGHR